MSENSTHRHRACRAIRVLRAGRRWHLAMSTLVLHARSPSASSFASSAPDDDSEFALAFDDAADATRSRDAPTVTHPGAVVVADPDARAAAVAEAAMTVASLQEELRDTKRRLEAYRGARVASRLIQTQKKTASALIEENPALAIPARLKEEARDLSAALEAAKARVSELEAELENARREAEDRARATIEAAAKKIDDARLVARAAREAETDARANGKHLSAALANARTALVCEQKRSLLFERESRVLHDTVLAAKTGAEEARAKALAEAAAARVAAREKLFAVLRAMGGDARGDDGDRRDDGTPASPIDRDRSIGSTARNDASTLGSPRVDPYAYAARLRSTREARR